MDIQSYNLGDIGWQLGKGVGGGGGGMHLANCISHFTNPSLASVAPEVINTN